MLPWWFFTDIVPWREKPLEEKERYLHVPSPEHLYGSAFAPDGHLHDLAGYFVAAFLFNTAKDIYTFLILKIQNEI
tara:strand:+ start:3297 stop:3524 length:228 start_codon:yes stop_codon:yes gene_type:complete